MGRLLLMLVAIGAATVGSTLFGSTDPSLTATEARTYEAARIALAREIALTGLGDVEAIVLEGLATYALPTLPLVREGAYQDGTFTATAEQADTLIVVVATGTFADATRSVRRAYRLRASAPPPPMRSALSVGNNLQVRGPLTISAPAPVAANVAVSGNLSLRDPAVSVTGFGSTSRRLQNRTGRPIEDLFVPAANPDGLPVLVEGAPSIPIPVPPVRDFEPLATQRLPRNSSLAGVYPLGTEGAPAIVYADGNLDTSGPVVFSGWGVVVVDGSFHVNHSIAQVPGTGRVMIVVKRHIEVRASGVALTGNWYAGGHLHVTDGLHLTDGSIAVGGNAHLDGDVRLDFSVASTSLTGLFWPDHMVPRTYREW